MKKLTLFILLFAGLTGFRPAQTRHIHGVVYGKDDNLPVPGVTIKVNGTTTGTQTNTAGGYNIDVPNGAVITISFIGYDTQNLTPGKSDILDIYLAQSNRSLNEVVVTGYQTQRKKDMTGSVSTAAISKQLSYVAAERSLQGRAQGLIVSKQYAPVPMNNANSPTDDESYSTIHENGFSNAKSNPLSTFSADVDVASYSNVRRFINNGQLPPADAVRVEEMINYFSYNIPGPTDNSPVAIHTELSFAPWNPAHRLVRIALKAKTIDPRILPPSNLVFLIDVSGSMDESNKLPLVKSALKMLTQQLRSQDKVAIVVYAGNAGLVLPSTSGAEKAMITGAIDNLSAGGSTAGGEGIKLAYKIAKQNFLPHGNNRIVLCTDGDFNVGASSDGDMEHLIVKERDSKVDISIMGFGMGNYKDSKMETMADKGNGNYAYIDNITEAKKSFVNEFGGTMFTIAKDVKLQVEFNPGKVQAYRLLGYEDRLLNKEDFNDDKKDAGDMGSGHTVTALYEIIPAGIKDSFAASVDPLKYQKSAPVIISTSANELMTVKFRYKDKNSSVSKMKLVTINDSPGTFSAVTADFRFAAAVAEFGMLLRDSHFKQKSSFGQAISIAKAARGEDNEGYRSEFVRLAESARLLSKPELASK